MDDLNEAVDRIYRGEHLTVPPETMTLIGRAMLQAEQGQTPEQIGKELNITPEQVREVVIRSRGWEATFREQEKDNYSRCRSYWR